MKQKISVKERFVTLTALTDFFPIILNFSKF